MAIIKAFKGIRPKKELVNQIASKPYDVLNDIEAKKEAEGNPYSFYHIIKPEIDFPEDFDHYAPEIYLKGKENFNKLRSEGVFFQDDKDCLYIYAQTMNGRKQYGIVAAAAIEDYFNDVIKKHELTRPDKEEDRKKHVRVSMLNYEPVFFAYPKVPALDKIVQDVVKGTPEYDFVADEGIGHTFWVIRDDNTIKNIIKEFQAINTYVADGHHRTAAAALVGKDLRSENKSHTGNEAYNYFLAVHFPDDQLAIMDYNRVVKDLNGLTADEFLKRLGKEFKVEKAGKDQVKPAKLHDFGMYLEGNWYKLTAMNGTYNDSDPILGLDVTVLSKHILEPILNIKDLRTDKRIEFVGGLRGLGELERRVNSGEMKVAFSLYPVSMKQLIDIADTGQIMPPKTTWFEPKLRSGLILHSLES
ncbi:MAG TPA: DUF1015 family protein [Bacteroidia bacterium]|nr:DUF1015 family protein [Bacteroidia bacterium]HNS11862.1 DUF1015 family protein [Bacteroidia bacterium]